MFSFQAFYQFASGIFPFAVPKKDIWLPDASEKKARPEDRKRQSFL
jgi:hypothetical protein